LRRQPPGLEIGVRIDQMQNPGHSRQTLTDGGPAARAAEDGGFQRRRAARRGMARNGRSVDPIRLPLCEGYVQSPTPRSRRLPGFFEIGSPAAQSSALSNGAFFVTRIVQGLTRIVQKEVTRCPRPARLPR
jgi:hypothetical protein